MSSEKLCQVTNLVRKKTNQAFQNRFHLKSSTETLYKNSPTVDDEIMTVDDDENAIQLTENNTTLSGTKILTRSDTFTRDPDETICNVNQFDTTHSIPNITTTLKSESFNRLGFGTSNIFDTSECLEDITMDDTLRDSKYMTHSNNDELQLTNQNDTQDLGDLTLVNDDELDSNRIGNSIRRKCFNSTMVQSNLLLDLTQANSPKWELLNMTCNTSSPVSPNTSKLLYMTQVADESSSDLDNTVVQCKNDNDCMDVDEHNSKSANILGTIMIFLILSFYIDFCHLIHYFRTNKITYLLDKNIFLSF